MHTRLRIVASLCLLLPLTSFGDEGPRTDRAGRPGHRSSLHVVLEPQHVLSEAERAALAASGCIIQRVLPGGRYVALLSSDSTVDASDLRVRRLTPITAEAKMDASAYRAAAQAKPFARVKVLFNDDASLDDARRAIEAAGGAVDGALTIDFEPMRSLRAHVPSATLLQLASDESVFSVYAVRTFKARNFNADEATLSNVTPLFSAPYNLSGAGVVLSYFELAAAQSTHPEFENRFSIDFTCASGDTQCSDAGNKLHATHVAGTMIAAGVNANAKGMAPKATLHELEAADPNDAWIGLKDTALKQLGSTADNNSWGYVVGWSPEGATGWTWNGADELIGGYDGTLSAVFDHIAIAGTTLMVHASGNEGGYTGPTAAPFRHNHTDDQGKATTDIYCYSTNGSGTDCPTVSCAAGASFCEVTRHPVHSPYGSVGWTASPKNVVAVGAVGATRTITGFSSRGPTKDGRVKPDLVAKGQNVLSTVPTSVYGLESGTSMAAPVVTASMALFVEQWRKIFGANASPAPVVLKALAIAGADDLGTSGPDYDYGFGLLDAKNSVDLIIADGGTGKRIKLDSAANGATLDYPLKISQTQDLRVVLSWFDPEALPLNSDAVTTKVLINDLDLKVVDASGDTVLPYVLDMANPSSAATRGVNKVDNTEEVEIKGASAGTYHVIVTGTSVPANPPQQFVVIANTDFGSAPPPCTDPTEPNSTPAAAYGPLATNSSIQARICGADDLDYFRFTPNASGSATVSVTASDAPLQVQLVTTSPGGPLVTVVSASVAARATETLTASVTNGVQYVIVVTPNGELGTDGGYTVSTTYPFSWPARRRAARR